MSSDQAGGDSPSLAPFPTKSTPNWAIELQNAVHNDVHDMIHGDPMKDMLDTTDVLLDSFRMYASNASMILVASSVLVAHANTTTIDSDWNDVAVILFLVSMLCALFVVLETTIRSYYATRCLIVGGPPSVSLFVSHTKSDTRAICWNICIMTFAGGLVVMLGAESMLSKGSELVVIVLGGVFAVFGGYKYFGLWREYHRSSINFQIVQGVLQQVAQQWFKARCANASGKQITDGDNIFRGGFKRPRGFHIPHGSYTYSEGNVTYTYDHRLYSRLISLPEVTSALHSALDRGQVTESQEQARFNPAPSQQDVWDALVSVGGRAKPPKPRRDSYSSSSDDEKEG